MEKLKNVILTIGKYTIGIIILLFYAFLMLFGSALSVYAESTYTKTGYSSVVTDLKNLNMYSLDNMSVIDNKFITLSQQYDLDNNLKTFIYLNYVGGSDDSISCSIIDTIVDSEQKIISCSLVSSDTTSYLRKYELDSSSLFNLIDTTRRYSVYSIYNNDNLIIDNIDKDFFFNGTSNSNIQCYYKQMETITITDKVIADYCYGDALDFFGKDLGSLQWGRDYVDSFFIFFNTDKPIENLIECEVYWVDFDYKIFTGNKGTDGGSILRLSYAFTEPFCLDAITHKEHITSTSQYMNYGSEHTEVIKGGKKIVSCKDYGWFNTYTTKYETLDNIMNMKEYKAKDESAFIFTDYATNYNWGVHFTDYSRQGKQEGPNGLSGYVSGTSVIDVAILRLKFETKGVQYNLLAVDKPSKDIEGVDASIDDDNSYWFRQIMEILGLVILLIGVVLLVSVIAPVFNVVKVIFKAFFYVLSLPFKLIKWAFRKK